MAHDTTRAVEPGADPAPPRVEVDGPRLRVRTAKFAPRPGTVGPRRSGRGAYRGRVGEDFLCAGTAGAGAAVRERPRAVSSGVAVDREAGEPGPARHAACRWERAHRRSLFAGCGSH